jgi:hypothetical protein
MAHLELIYLFNIQQRVNGCKWDNNHKIIPWDSQFADDDNPIIPNILHNSRVVSMDWFRGTFTGKPHI